MRSSVRRTIAACVVAAAVSPAAAAYAAPDDSTAPVVPVVYDAATVRASAVSPADRAAAVAAQAAADKAAGRAAVSRILAGKAAGAATDARNARRDAAKRHEQARLAVAKAERQVREARKKVNRSADAYVNTTVDMYVKTLAAAVDTTPTLPKVGSVLSKAKRNVMSAQDTLVDAQRAARQARAAERKALQVRTTAGKTAASTTAFANKTNRDAKRQLAESAKVSAKVSGVINQVGFRERQAVRTVQSGFAFAQSSANAALSGISRDQKGVNGEKVAAMLNVPGVAVKDRVIPVGMTQLGTPYIWGGTTPNGFDCSGFTQWTHRQVGVDIPRTAREQQAAATPVSDPRPGDLVFFGAPAHHVGIYLGDGMMLHSPHTGSELKIAKVYGSASGYGRFIN